MLSVCGGDGGLLLSELLLQLLQDIGGRLASISISGDKPANGILITGVQEGINQNRIKTAQ